LLLPLPLLPGLSGFPGGLAGGPEEVPAGGLPLACPEPWPVFPESPPALPPALLPLDEDPLDAALVLPAEASWTPELLMLSDIASRSANPASATPVPTAAKIKAYSAPAEPS